MPLIGSREVRVGMVDCRIIGSLARLEVSLKSSASQGRERDLDSRTVSLFRTSWLKAWDFTELYKGAI
ncbi:hypothetical protein D3C81_2337730 [compost metagenome]